MNLSTAFEFALHVPWATPEKACDKLLAAFDKQRVGTKYGNARALDTAQTAPLRVVAMILVFQ